MTPNFKTRHQKSFLGFENRSVDAKELAKQKALDSCKEFKIQLLKARERGLFLNDKTCRN